MKNNLLSLSIFTSTTLAWAVLSLTLLAPPEERKDDACNKWDHATLTTVACPFSESWGSKLKKAYQGEPSSVLLGLL